MADFSSKVANTVSGGATQNYNDIRTANQEAKFKANQAYEEKHGFNPGTIEESYKNVYSNDEFAQYDEFQDDYQNLARSVVQLYEVGQRDNNSELVEQAQAMRDQLAGVMPESVLMYTGLQGIPTLEEDGGGFSWSKPWTPATDLLGSAFGGDNPFSNFVGEPLLRGLDAFARPVWTTIGGIAHGDAEAIAGGILEGGLSVTAAPLGLTDAVLDMDDSGTGASPIALFGFDSIVDKKMAEWDEDGDGVSNFREILGVDPEWGGRWAGLADTVLLAATDPLTYVGIGVAGKAAIGIRALEKAGASRATLRMVRAHGIGVLSEAQQKAMREQLLKDLAEAGGKRRLGRLGGKARERTVAEANKAAEEALRALDNGVGTFSFAGKQINDPMTKAWRRMRTRGLETSDFGPEFVDATRNGSLDAARSMFKGATSVTKSPGGVGFVVEGTATTTRGNRTLFDYTAHADSRTSTVTLVTRPAADATESGVRTRGRAFRTWLADEQDRLAAQGFTDIRVVTNADDIPHYGNMGHAFDLEDATTHTNLGLVRDQMRASADSLEERLNRLLAQHTPAPSGLPPSPYARRRPTPPPKKVPTATATEIENLRTQVKNLRTAADDIDNGLRAMDGDIDQFKWKASGVSDAIDPELQFKMGRVLDDPDQMTRVIRRKTGKLWNPEAATRARLERASMSRKQFKREQKARSRVQRVGARAQRRLDKTRKLGSSVADTFKTRQKVARLLGRGAERSLDRARTTADGLFQKRMQDLDSRLGGAADEAAAEAAKKGHNGMEWADEQVREALEYTEAAAESFGDDFSPRNYIERQAAEAERMGNPALARYMRVAGDLRDELEEISMKYGLDETKLHTETGYFPRSITAEGEQALLDSQTQWALDARDRLFGAEGGGAMGSAEARARMKRTFFPNKSIEEANELLNMRLGTNGVKYFEDRVYAAFAMRGDAAYRAAADIDMLRSMANDSIQIGGMDTPLAVFGRPQRNPGAYHRLSVVDDIAPEGVYVLKEIREDVEKIHKIITNDENLAKFREHMSNWSKMWGAHATSPLLDGLGFHSRNAVSNVMLNMVAGITNPAVYRDAYRQQRNIAKVQKHMRSTGMQFDEAARAIGISEADLKMLDAMRTHGVANSGYFKDIERTTKEYKDRGRSRRQRAGFTTDYDGLWDIMLDNPVIKSGRRLGNVVENNARMAHFISKMNAGQTAEMAARSVRTHLFDYGDLTNVEQSIRDYTMRFYTFARKNLGVQLYGMARYPGRMDAIQEVFTGGGIENAAGAVQTIPGQPDYSIAAGQSLPLAGVLGIEDDANLVGGIDTPLNAAFEFARPLVEMIELGAAVAKGDDWDEAYRETLSSIVNMGQGAVPSAVNLAFGLTADWDYFLDREISEKDKKGEAILRRTVDALIGPVWGQVDTALERLTEGEGVGFLGDDPSEFNKVWGRETALLNNLMGLGVAAGRSQEDFTKDQMYMMRAEAKTLLDSLRDDGVPVPSFEQLQDAGLAPGSFEQSVQRADSVKLRERIEEAREAGLPTDILEERLERELAEEAEAGYEIDEETGEYTTQLSRAGDFALEQGFVTESGNPSRASAVYALYNQENPNDQVLKDDGTPYGVRDIPVVWGTLSSSAEVKEWWKQETGVELNSLRNDVIAEYNRFHDRPYIRGTEDKLDAGHLPTQGVYEWVTTDPDTGGKVVTEVWAKGWTEDDWTLDPEYVAEEFGAAERLTPGLAEAEAQDQIRAWD